MSTNNRLWIIVTVIGCLAIAALGWLLGISPKLAEAADANAQRVRVDALNQQYSEQLVKLRADYENLGQVKEELADAQAQLPPGSDYSSFLSNLNSIAAQNSVEFAGVGFAAPQVLAPPVVVEETPPPADADGDAPPAEAAAAPPVEAAGTGAPSGSTVAIPTTLTFSGPYSDLQDAAGDLQSGTRLFLVSGLAFSQDQGETEEGEVGPADGYTLVITGLLYVLTDGTTLIETAPAPTDTALAPTETSTPPAG